MAPTPIKSRVSHRNAVLIPGVHRFGRSKMYHKRGIKVKRTVKNTIQKTAIKKPVYIEKPVGGSQNGGKRMVKVRKSKTYHPTATAKRRRIVKRPQVARRPKLRRSLQPGTVLILLAGRHAGKRVVFLKELMDSGFLLVTGPFKLNGVPLRRVHQQYVIATSTRLDISEVNVPACLNDAYFRRDKKAVRKQRRKQEGDIFAAEKEGYTLPLTRKEDQMKVDKQILNVVKSNKDKKLLLKYLASAFSLKSGQLPHKLKF